MTGYFSTIINNTFGISKPSTIQPEPPGIFTSDYSPTNNPFAFAEEQTGAFESKTVGTPGKKSGIEYQEPLVKVSDNNEGMVLGKAVNVPQPEEWLNTGNKSFPGPSLNIKKTGNEHSLKSLNTTVPTENSRSVSPPENHSRMPVNSEDTEIKATGIQPEKDGIELITPEPSSEDHFFNVASKNVLQTPDADKLETGREKTVRIIQSGPLNMYSAEKTIPFTPFSKNDSGKEFIELNPTKPAVSFNDKVERPATKLVIGKLSVEVIQTGKEMAQHIPAEDKIIYKPAPVSAPSGGGSPGIKVRYGLGQL